jgi:hypothetical protein
MNLDRSIQQQIEREKNMRALNIFMNGYHEYYNYAQERPKNQNTKKKESK